MAVAYSIYVVTNVITGKPYVGCSTNYKKRWIKHRGDARRGFPGLLYDALREDGATNFEIKVVETCTSKKKAFAAEARWVVKLDSFANGYNQTPSGHSLGVKFTETQRQRARESRAGKRPSEETKRKISETTKGKTITKTWRQNISKALKGKKRPSGVTEKLRAKGVYDGHPVEQIFNGQVIAVYPSIADAARTIRRNKRSLKACIDGKRKTCGGFEWRRVR